MCKWWGAVVIGPSSPSSTIVREGAQGAVETTECEQVVKNVMLDEVPLELAHQFVLKYEPGEGFEEEEVATIAFLSDRECFCTRILHSQIFFRASSQPTCLSSADWLYDVGKGFELAFRKLGDVWEPEEEEEEADGAAVISIASFSGEAERARNREILAAASDSLMAGLDPFRQRLVAGGIQQFTEVLGSMIRSKPEGSIITREDVEEAFRGKKPRL